MQDKLIHVFILLFLSFVSCDKKSKDCYSDYSNFSFIISDGFISEYDSDKKIFRLEFPMDSVTNIPLTLTNEEVYQINGILCKYDFSNLEVDNRKVTKTITIISGPGYKYSLKVVSKNFSKEVILDAFVRYNNPNRDNKKFIKMWAEIWDIIVNRQGIKEKMPNF